MENNIENLLEKLSNVSKKPGVYLMRDLSGNVLYIGKALNLRKRIAFYFNNTKNRSLKISVMVKKIVDFETIITFSEKEAIVLENNLIKKFKPRYNVLLKDDKSYLFLRINSSISYPRLEIVKAIKKDNAHYFGPFISISSLQKTLTIVNKTFKLRKCKDKEIKKRSRPCINYQMGNCFGPCCVQIDPVQYSLIVSETILFLKGKTKKLIQKIKERMDNAALEQNFELAAKLRDKSIVLENTLENQIIVFSDLVDRDILGVVVRPNRIIITVLFVRGGILQGSQHFKLFGELATREEAVLQFIKQYYGIDHYIPNEIIVPETSQYFRILEEILSRRKTQKIRIIRPLKGNKKKLLEMANVNAKNEFIRLRGRSKHENKMFLDLKSKLNMNKIPRTIECFDNSFLYGTMAVSAMVVFKYGKPYKSSYRKYILKTNEKCDDYAYMKEVLTRRYKNKKLPLPDLLMVDGGIGQLNIATLVLKEMKLESEFPVLSIAKKNKKLGENIDKIYISNSNDPVKFKKNESTILYLQRIRDEAHRCALSFQIYLRNKSTTKSSLDEITGIGRKKKVSLLKHFGGIKKIRAATIEQITEVPGISRTLAGKIKIGLL